MQTAADVPIKDLPETWQLYKTQQTSLQKCSPRLRNHANRCGRPYKQIPREFAIMQNVADVSTKVLSQTSKPRKTLQASQQKCPPPSHHSPSSFESPLPPAPLRNIKPSRSWHCLYAAKCQLHRVPPGPGANYESMAKSCD